MSSRRSEVFSVAPRTSRTRPSVDCRMPGSRRTRWSSFDVVAHLIEAEETNWIPRARHPIAHGESAGFPPFDRFGFRERSTGMRVAGILDAFKEARARSLLELEDLGLTREDLERRG